MDNPQPQARTGALLVLVVEDEEPIAESVAYVVEDAGHAAVVAKNGREALDRISAGLRPDLIITDLMMPHMDGAALIRALRAGLGPEMPPIVLMTAAGRRHGDAVSADAFLAKPFDLDDLDALLGRFLGAPDRRG